MKIKSYDQAAKYLESFIGKIKFEITPESLKHHDPLERMRVLLDLLGDPQDKFPSVLIGGTSGKGSTAYLISHILTTAGYKTALTTSPHLQKINERIQINGKSILDEKFTQMVSSIVRTIELMERMMVGAPSYFELLIAMAFLYFEKEKVDIAIVEVGLGGEFDATNTLYPLVAVLTNVSLDHTSILGGSVQKIARTKVGIIKDARGPVAPSSHPMSSVASSLRALDGTPSSRATPRLLVITGAKQPSVIKIVEERCKEVGAEVFRLGKDLPAGGQGFDFKIKKESLKGSVFDLTITRDRVLQLNNLTLSLLGRHQVENASLAIETVLQLKKFGFNVSNQQIRISLKTAFFAGRFEIISLKDTKIQIVLDGAHNPTKIRAFLSTLKRLYPKNPKVFVIGFKKDKDIKGMLRQILKVAEVVIVTEFSAKTDTSVRASFDAFKLKSQISKVKSNVRVVVEKDLKKALDKVLSLSTIQQFNNPTIIVVTGSLYLVGEVRNML